MARLTRLPSRLTALPPRLGAAPAATRKEAEAIRLRERDKDKPWRKWYYTQRWKDLRKAVLERDAYTCRRTGIICVGKHPSPNSPVADHIVAHNGDPELFWDINNVQTVSKGYHDTQKQSQERSYRW
ncbi:HNH endonuclease [Pararhizobium sp.]|uniref:HNH endonuclease n=1 Tax=Pararhizobium sp. TaxID=1977563 RepID=UPI003D0B8063